jgi:hypothetical protein
MTVSDAGIEVPAIVAKIPFGKIHVSGYSSVHAPTLRQLASLGGVRILFCANPTSAKLLTTGLFKIALCSRVRLAAFDLAPRYRALSTQR